VALVRDASSADAASYNGATKKSMFVENTLHLSTRSSRTKYSKMFNRRQPTPYKQLNAMREPRCKLCLQSMPPVSFNVTSLNLIRSSYRTLYVATRSRISVQLWAREARLTSLLRHAVMRLTIGYIHIYIYIYIVCYAAYVHFVRFS